jgi:succinoglycan biosynthesis transport protein ExoP
MPSGAKQITVFDYLRPLWRFKWVTILVVGLTVYGVHRYYDNQPKSYRSSAQLFVGSSTLTEVLTGTARLSSSRDLANQAQLIATPRTAEAVAKHLGGGISGEALLGALVVTPSTDADFITITATTNSPEMSARIANAFATVYLRQREEAVREATRKALELARQRYRETPRHNTIARENGLQAITDLENRLAAPADVGTISRRAIPSNVPLGQSPRRNAIFGGLLALLLCVIAAYIFDRSDRKLRKVEDVETLYDAPVLASVPHVRRPAPVSAGVPEVPGPLREPHRTLRVNLMLRAGSDPPRTILFTSAVPEEGKSTVVRNLALAYAHAGSRVAVVEADMRRPTLARLFGLDGSIGLAEVLLGKARTDEALQDVGQPPSLAVNGNGNGHGSSRLQVMIAGSTIVEPTSVLTADRLRPLIARLLVSHDVILFDSPPVLPVSDALPLLSVVDGTVLVARSGVTTWDAAARLQRTLSRVEGVNILGTVVTAVNDAMAYGYENERPSGAGAPTPEQAAP